MVSIGKRMIGKGHPCFVIAEAGVNHNGDFSLAKKLIDAAVEAKADAVKFQTFRAEQLVTQEAPKAKYQKETTGAEESQWEMLKKLELPEAWHWELKSYCEQKGILFLSTPFDEACADLLEKIGVPLYKIPSGEITNLGFLSHVAKKMKPILLSTGMSDLEEVREAVKTIYKAGNKNLILLHCVSQYPTEPEDVNLLAMKTLEKEFQIPVGFSDHTLGIEIPLAAVALGASVIEKHFTLDKKMPGPDHRASLEPEELRAMVEGIRKIEAALGNGEKKPAACERDTAQVARKSLVAARAISAGALLREEDVAVKRPGTGLSPARREELIGSRAKKDIPAGTLFAMEMFQK